MAVILTPGLTPLQATRLRADLLQLTRLPEAIASGIYVDADRIAGRYMMSPHAADHQNARCTTTALLEWHSADGQLVAYIAGLAHGVRLGRRFSPKPRPRAKWISEEYKRLAEPNRRDVQRFIRKLLKALEPPRPKAASLDEEAVVIRKWIQEAGRQARAGR